MNILIIQLRRIGDVVVTTPVIDVLRRRFPDARVDFLVEPAAAPVLEGYPGLTERLVFEKKRYWHWAREVRRRRYDTVLDFMNNPRTAQLTWASGAPVRAGFVVPFWSLVYTHRVPRPTEPLYACQNKFLLLQAIGVPAPKEALPRLSIGRTETGWMEGWARSVGIDRCDQRIALMPKHRHAVRQWPAHKFVETMERLSKPGRAFVLVGGPDERDYLDDVARPFPGRAWVAPVQSLAQAAAALSACDVAVTNDSGLMHMAVSVGTPTVTVYGPTSPGSWNPRRPPHRFLQAEGLACLVCNRDRCPFGHECMEWVSPGRMALEVEALLERGGEPRREKCSFPGP